MITRGQIRNVVEQIVGQTLDAETELATIERGEPWNPKEWYL